MADIDWQDLQNKLKQSLPQGSEDQPTPTMDLSQVQQQLQSMTPDQSQSSTPAQLPIPQPEQSPIPSFLRVQPKQINIPTPGGPEFSMDQLKQAQQQRDMAQLANRLGMAGETIGSAIAQTQPVATKGFEENIKAADQYVNNIQEKLAADKFDPNSHVSQVYRGLMKRFGVKVGDNVNANDLEKAFPVIEKAAEQEQNKQMDMLKAQYIQDARKQMAEERQGRKEEILQQNNAIKMNQQAEQLLGGRGPLSRPNLVSQAADKLEALASQYGSNLDKMPPQMVGEFVQAFNTMITQGQGNTAVFKKLLPKDIGMDGSQIFQWISNNPTGAAQGEFIKAFLNSARTEKAVAQAQIKEGMIAHANAYQGKVAPHDLQNFMNMRGITPEDQNTYNKPGSLISKAINPEQKQSDIGIGLPAMSDIEAEMKRRGLK